MGLFGKVKEWFSPKGNEQNNRGDEKLAPQGAPLPRIQIPSDEEFSQRGWIVGNWFNHANLTSILNVPDGWDEARMRLQKVAYEITRASHPQDQQDWYRQMAATFVQQDPLYLDSIDRIKDAIRESPGLIQSEIYKGRSDKEKEGARYILYYAEVLGDITREKSGRSYRLNLPAD